MPVRMTLDPRGTTLPSTFVMTYVLAVEVYLALLPSNSEAALWGSVAALILAEFSYTLGVSWNTFLYVESWLVLFAFLQVVHFQGVMNVRNSVLANSTRVVDTFVRIYSAQILSPIARNILGQTFGASFPLFLPFVVIVALLAYGPRACSAYLKPILSIVITHLLHVFSGLARQSYDSLPPRIRTAVLRSTIHVYTFWTRNAGVFLNLMGRDWSRILCEPQALFELFIDVLPLIRRHVENTLSPLVVRYWIGCTDALYALRNRPFSLSPGERRTLSTICVGTLPIVCCDITNTITSMVVTRWTSRFPFVFLVLNTITAVLLTFWVTTIYLFMIGSPRNHVLDHVAFSFNAWAYSQMLLVSVESSCSWRFTGVNYESHIVQV